MYFPPKGLPWDTRPWEETIALSLWEPEADSGSCPFLSLSFLIFKKDMITCTSPGGYGGSMSPPAECKQESLELFPPDRAEAQPGRSTCFQVGAEGGGLYMLERCHSLSHPHPPGPSALLASPLPDSLKCSPMPTPPAQHSPIVSSTPRP